MKETSYKVQLQKDIHGVISQVGSQNVAFKNIVNSIELRAVGGRTDFIFNLTSNGEGQLYINKKSLSIYPELSSFATSENSSYVILNIKNLSVNSKANLQIKVESRDGGELETVEFGAQHIAIKQKGKPSKNVFSPHLNINLPKNFFELINDGLIEAKNLPQQMFDAIIGTENPNIEHMVIGHKSKQLKVLKVKSPTTGKIKNYIASGQNLIPFEISGVYLHEARKNSNFLGIIFGKGFGKDTKGISIRNLPQESLKNLIAFLEEGSLDKVTVLNSEEFKKQAIFPRSYISPYEREKRVPFLPYENVNEFLAGAEKQKPSDEKLEQTKVEDQTEIQTEEASTEETTIELNNKNQTSQKSKLSFELPEENIDDEIIDDETVDDGDGTTGAAEVTSELDLVGNKEVENSKPVEAPKTEMPAKPNTSTDEQKNKIKDKEASPENDKKNAPEKKEQEKKNDKPSKETIDLSGFATLMGLSIFLFGIFAGIGGVLLTIIAIAVGSGTYSVSKKAEKTPIFPQGKGAALNEIKKMNINPKIKSSKDKEIKVIEGLAQKNLISKEFSDHIISLINGFREEKSLYENLKKGIDKTIKVLEAKDAKLQEQIDKKYKKGHSTSDLAAKQKEIRDSIEELGKQRTELDTKLTFPKEFTTEKLNKLKELAELNRQVEVLKKMDLENTSNKLFEEYRQSLRDFRGLIKQKFHNQISDDFKERLDNLYGKFIMVELKKELSLIDQDKFKHIIEELEEQERIVLKKAQVNDQLIFQHAKQEKLEKQAEEIITKEFNKDEVKLRTIEAKNTLKNIADKVSGILKRLTADKSLVKKIDKTITNPINDIDKSF